MIHITKGEPLPEFEDFVKKEQPEKWEDIRSSERHPNLTAKCINHILQNEQNNLSGYTEKPIANRPDLHIDHFRKKGLPWPKNVSFDWNNLIVDEYNHNYGACYKDDLTKSTDDYDLLLNPVTDHPETLMDYRFDGKIQAKADISELDKKRVDFTIARFNLQHASLRGTRSTLIKYITEDYQDLNDEEVKSSLQDSGFPTVVDWALRVRAYVGND